MGEHLKIQSSGLVVVHVLMKSSKSRSELSTKTLVDSYNTQFQAKMRKFKLMKGREFLMV
jgi:hypothetical protein